MEKTHNGEFKSDVALVALIGELTIAEISKRYNVPESVVRRWRREGLEHTNDVKNIYNSLFIFIILRDHIKI